VSIDSAGLAQNQAVAEPFVTASDVSSGGRFVTWDSDADNLVAGDLNLDTDIFVRDVRNGRTSLASRSLTGKQGNNDSYFPAISSNGRYVAFTSFARNYWPVDAAGEDLFMYDRRLGVTVPLTVTSTGGLRGAETDRQLLRRASLSDSAHRVAFTSSAPLTSGDDDSLEDAYVRLTSAPDGRMLIGPPRNTSRSRPRFRLDVDDPAAVFICRVDRRPRFFCPLSGRLPTLSRGRHRFSAQAGGPGMLFDASPNVRTFRVR
jgi:hypothetical protein